MLEEQKSYYKGLSKQFILDNKHKLSVNDCIKYHKFTEEELTELIGYINLKKVLVHQNLSLDFIFTYILNPSYQHEDNERMINEDMVVQYQKYTIFDLIDYKKKHITFTNFNLI